MLWFSRGPTRWIRRRRWVDVAGIGCEIGVLCSLGQVEFVLLEVEMGKIVETRGVIFTWVVRVESKYTIQLSLTTGLRLAIFSTPNKPVGGRKR